MKNECPTHQYASDLYRCPYCAADQSNSSSMACSKVDLEVELSLAVDARDKYERMMLRMREALQTIYSHNGEDPVIARICNELIEASRDY